MGEEMMMKKGCLILLLSVYTCLLLAVPTRYDATMCGNGKWRFYTCVP